VIYQSYILLVLLVIILTTFFVAVFILGTPTQIYKFLASSETEKESWVKKLESCIKKEKEAFVEVKT